MRTGTATILDFLGQRRLALVGVSREAKDFSRGLFRELLARGYDVVPVNPNGGTMEGRVAVPRVLDVRPPVDGALVLTPPEATERVVRECAAAGVRRVWLHRGAGRGAVSEEAVAFCREQGIAVVAGECPYMFLPKAGLFHRLHGLLRRLERRGPSTAAGAA